MTADNYLSIENPDVPIHRIFRLSHFMSLLETRELVFVRPHLWDDPYEHMLSQCKITEVSNGKFVREQIINRQTDKVWSQCWSSSGDSDTLWRAYSIVLKDGVVGRNKFVEHEGVMISTTVRKLFECLTDGIDGAPLFLGKVQYGTSEQIFQYVANEAKQRVRQGFSNPLTPRDRAAANLIKRSSFRHEEEIRAIIVDQELDDKRDLIMVKIKLENLIQRVSFDPRLPRFEFMERKQLAESHGVPLPIAEPELYIAPLLNVILETDK